MDPEKITYFGETDSRGKRVKFGIRAKDRTKHVYVIGKTGMGKSTLLENMAIQDLQNGEGLAFIDPHGGTAELLLNFVPPERMKDVIYFAPFDIEHPISFNVMEDVGPDKRHLVVAGLMSAFKKLFGEESFSDRMQYILQNTILALLEYPGATMLGINRMLTDKAYRNKVVANVKDTSVKAYWTQEFANYTERFTAEATPAVQNKIGQFTSNPLIRNIIGQPKSSFDFRDIMDNKKIFIANLSKGLVGEANAQLLGSMIITKIYLAAMSRADISKKDLVAAPNFYFYVDEFQSFANESFADILSEARKYKLNLTIANQYIDQMAEEVRSAVFGNVGTMITFRVGAYDADVLEKEFAPQFTAEDLVNLGMYQMYLKLMINAMGSPPFSASSLPPIPEPVISYKSEIIENSRKVFAKPKAEVEDMILKWHEEGRVPPKTSGSSFDSKKSFGSHDNRKPYQPPTTRTVPEKLEAARSESGQVKKPYVEKEIQVPVEKVFQKPVPVSVEAKKETPVSIVKPVEPKSVIAEKPKHEKHFPPMEESVDDDFLPLKELAKKLVIEPKKVYPVKSDSHLTGEEVKKADLPAHSANTFGRKPKTDINNIKTMSPGNLSDLRSALAAVMKKSDTVAPKDQPQIKKEEPKTEPKIVETQKEKAEESKYIRTEINPNDPSGQMHSSGHQTKEIPEEDLKKILGL